jgi:hypothetical protein
MNTKIKTQNLLDLIVKINQSQIAKKNFSAARSKIKRNSKLWVRARNFETFLKKYNDQ